MKERRYQQNPFPGIRNFEPEEDFLFFGRDEQIEKILQIIYETHFLALIGYSGSGKSSLIKAGVIPSIAKGNLMPDTTATWETIYFRPNENPFSSFAGALQNQLAQGTVEPDEAILGMEEFLKDRGRTLRDVYQRIENTSAKSWLIVVDQFEELFRFGQQSDHESKQHEVQQFVDLLLSGLEDEALPVYIIISMRSDFLDDCTEYAGLLEAINLGSYLLPKISREGFKDIIEKPIAITGATISEKLVEMLLHDVEQNPDQLPVLQHALMRTWEYWDQRKKGNIPIDVEHYEAIGTMATALSVHAEEIYGGLPNTRLQKVTETLFKALTHVNISLDKGTRRPVPLQELVKLSNVSRQDVEDVIDEFRAPGRAFLMPAYRVDLDSNTVIDIAHESIMRIWGRLKDWAQEEAKSAELYLRLSKSAELYQQGKTGLWVEPDLALAIQWQQEQQPNATWAAQYNPAFDRTMNFLEYSKKEALFEVEQKERRQRSELIRARRTALVLGAASIISILLFVYSFSEGIRAAANEKKAKENEKLAHLASLQAGRERKEAVLQQKIATQQQQIAEEEKQITEEQKSIAITQQQIAEEQKTEALNQKQLALEASRQAIVAKNEAETQRNEAVAQRKMAEVQKSIADTQRGIAERSEKNTQRLRLLSIARTIAIESAKIRNRTEGDLPALLALQAYFINKENGGFENNPNVFSALADVADNNSVIRSHSDAVRGITASVDGRVMVTGSDDGTVRLWQKQSDKSYKLLYRLNTGKVNQEVRAVGVSSDAHIVVAGTVGGYLLKWGPGNEKNVPEVVKAHNGTINKIIYMPGREKFITASSDGSVKVWNIHSLQEPVMSYDLGSPVLSVAYSEKSGMIVCGTNNGTMGLIRFTGESNELARYTNDSNPIQSIALAENGETIVTGNSAGTIKLWNIRDMKKKPMELIGHRSGVTSIRFSPDQRTFASSSYDNTIRIWTMSAIHENPIILEGNSSWVMDLYYAADGRSLVSAGADKSIRVFHVNKEELVQNLCNRVKRDLTQEEWDTYIGRDIAYKKTCAALQ